MELNEFNSSPLEIQLYDLLERKGPLTRDEIVKEINRPRTTILGNLTRLQNKNKIKNYSRPTNSRGRPLVFFKVKEVDDYE